MDMLDQALDSSSQDKTNESNTSDEAAQIKIDDGTVGDGGDEQVPITNVSSAGTANLIDPASGVQYQFRTENGQGGACDGAVTYRVVQVTQGAGEPHDGGAQVITTTSFAGQQGVQAVIASPFSNGNSPTGEGQGAEARFAYYPTVATTNDSASTAEGQFYVMMSPQDVLTPGQRSIAPRTHQFPKSEGTRTARDERRRATHNEVERRRRDKINNWIIKLSKIVPDCAQDHTKQGQVSKGGILAKACDYIHDLRSSNQRLSETLKDSERLTLDVELLRQQCEELKNENAMLRAQLQQHGIVLTELAPNS